jgi:hypothetical protein
MARGVCCGVARCMLPVAHTRARTRAHMQTQWSGYDATDEPRTTRLTALPG